MIMIMPYLNFTGDCEEAFRLYQRAFDGQEPLLARYGEMPEDPARPMDEIQKRKIMHGHVMLTETYGVSGADAMWPVEKGSAISIHVYCDSVEKAEQALNILAEEGAGVHKLQQNPPPHDHGMSGCVTDKYGFTWVLSAQLD